jgi:hypothetical protein
MKCPREKCKFEWTPRKANPKACPKCKCYIKYPVETVVIGTGVTGELDD